jgi:Cupredoxin-like domain
MFHSRIFIAIFTVLFIAAGIIACGGGATPAAPANVTVVNLEANDSGCTPKNIETEQGNLVKLTLKNSGTTSVKFEVPDVPFTLTAEPGKTAPGNFTAPTKAGSYNYTCSSSANETKGELKVKND